MSRYTIPPLIPGALYEFRSKPMKDAANVSMLPDGYITMINEFVREEDSHYVYIMFTLHKVYPLQEVR